ncbi:hypothetical protein T11_16418 [Trichinella zimbabwensis]|uniref:Uncharacterized protein n=1 Tax=Trichinella zimbabwensis TaxID=268475 RepID=A0A0V1H900_9BILA|nr:hypothetical protein T11_16418 [Trichinella zimbabwensis]
MTPCVEENEPSGDRPLSAPRMAFNGIDKEGKPCLLSLYSCCFRIRRSKFIRVVASSLSAQLVCLKIMKMSHLSYKMVYVN